MTSRKELEQEKINLFLKRFNEIDKLSLLDWILEAKRQITYEGHNPNEVIVESSVMNILKNEITKAGLNETNTVYGMKIVEVPSSVNAECLKIRDNSNRAQMKFMESERIIKIRKGNVRGGYIWFPEGMTP